MFCRQGRKIEGAFVAYLLEEEEYAYETWLKEIKKADLNSHPIAPKTEANADDVDESMNNSIGDGDYSEMEYDDDDAQSVEY